MVYCTVLCLAACLASPIAHSAEPKLDRGVRSIQLAQHEDGMITVYHVMLDWRFKTAELDTLSNRIRQAAPRSKLLLVLYFLRGMKPEQGAWAVSTFNPDLAGFEVEINELNTNSNPPHADLRANVVR